MAYALIPFAVKAIFEFFAKTNFRNALKVSFWLILVGLISHHFIVLIFLFFTVAFLVYIFKLIVCHSRPASECGRNLPSNRFRNKFGMTVVKHRITKILYLWKNQEIKKEIFKILKYTILILLIFSIFSIWWIAPYFNINSSRGEFIQEAVGQEDFNVFQTASDDKYGVLINAAALYGFWGDRMDRYTVPKDVMFYWPILFLIIFSLAVFGAISALKKNKFITSVFIIVSAAAFILSVGIAYKPFAPIINFLYDKIFIFKGFREPQKFSALLVLAYAYFGAIGINSILNNFKIQKLVNFKILLAAFFIALPILYSPLMVWGFKGQLYTSHYPQEWFETNEILNEDKDNFKVLFFPWHQYMSFSFAKNKVFANPAPNFFDKEIIAGDNMELGEIYSHSQKPISQFIENEILEKRNEINNLGEMLTDFNIKYIILAKEVDWQEYKFLDGQNDIELICDVEYLKIYQNKNWQDK